MKERFDGGVLYMRFGRHATVEKAIREISKVIALTGAIPSAKKGESANSIADTVDLDAKLYSGKVSICWTIWAYDALAAQVLSVPSC